MRLESSGQAERVSRITDKCSRLMFVRTGAYPSDHFRMHHRRKKKAV